MVEKDDLNIPVIATVGVVSVVLTIASVFAVQALYFTFANREEQRKIVEAPTADSDSRLAEQEARLVRYSWVSRENGTVTIPIEQAMKFIVRDLNENEAESNRSPARRSNE